MKKYILIVLVGMFVFAHCGGEKEQLISSNTIDELTTIEPSLKADGLSQITVTAMVLDSLGYPASEKKVFFSTTLGTITRSSWTNSAGKAEALLTSIASESDLMAVITATVIDSTLLKKGMGFNGSVLLSTLEYPIYGKLAKSLAGSPSARLDVRLLGLDFSAQFERLLIPADGNSQTKLEISIRESSSGKSVPGAKIVLRSKRVSIPAELVTNDKGIAQTMIPSPLQAVIDTVAMDYGRFKSKTAILSFVQTRLFVSPKKIKMAADGTSRTVLTAKLITHDNNPVIGATIRFTSAAGIISGSSVTNVRGEAFAELTSPDKIASASRVIANFNGVADTALVDYVATMTTGMELQMDHQVYRDGQSVLPCTAILFDDNQKPVAYAPVHFRTTVGAIDSMVSTDVNGRAVAFFKTDVGENDIPATITAEHAGLHKTITTQLLGITMNVTVNPDSIIADGRSTSLLTILLKGTSGHEAITDAGLSLATNHGTIINRTSTDATGVARATLTAGTTIGTTNVQIKYAGLMKTVPVYLLGSVAQKLVLQSLSGDQFPRDGITVQSLQAQLLDNHNDAVPRATVRLNCKYGVMDTLVTTDLNGIALIRYKSDAAINDAEELISAKCGGISSSLNVNLLGITLLVTSAPDSIPADGKSIAKVTAQLKYTTSNAVLSNKTVNFSATFGSMPTSSQTDELGKAVTSFTAATTPGKAILTAYYGGLTKSTQINLVADTPMTILLTSTPSYIWVKETGNLDQTIVSATVLSTTGQPLGNETFVRFFLRNGPGGGEKIAPAKSGSDRESVAIRTVDGKAQMTLQSGIRSGTVEIQAELADRAEIKSRITNVTIRSGPPYIWVDPIDKNHVVSHMTLALDVFNVEGWNHVRKLNASVYVGDKYNNPVEQGTTVYLTGTAGIITTDLATDASGEGAVVWSSANPRPFVSPDDGTALSPHRIPNPNDASKFIPIVVPDFEGGLVLSSAGDKIENDGVAYIMASTHGKDQNGQDAVVYATNSAVFSGPILVFDVKTDKTTLKLGEAALITIRVYDINGNPPARGSSLSASSSAGKISNTSLMSPPDRYGYGSTIFKTYVLNNLDPIKDTPATSEVTIKLDSPNGSATSTVFINLLLEP